MNKRQFLLDQSLLEKSGEISRMLEAVAGGMGADLDYLNSDEQLALMRRALELRALFKKRAERFQVYWSSDNE